MEFTEEHVKRLLSTEWLAKSDPTTSTPYLFKYNFSSAELSSCLLITDTKSVWGEVISSKQLARRWRSLNSLSPEPFVNQSREDAWREQTFELLCKTHTIGGVAGFSFEIVRSHYSDLAFQLECEGFKWRWETNFLGHKFSSEIISKHLVFPLISLNHLTFSSTEAFGELPDTEVEKAVDKLSRTARRTTVTHIKNALSKPRVATTIRRMTAMFNFVQDLQPVLSTAEKPDLQVEQLEPEELSPPPEMVEQPVEQKPQNSPSPPPRMNPNKRDRSVPLERQPDLVQPDSATESEGDEPMNISTRKPGSLADIASSSKSTAPTGKKSDRHSVATPPPASKIPPTQTSDSDSSPHRPVKKAKSKALASSDDGSSTEERKSRMAGAKTATTTGTVKRGGTRQPIKRGAKRF